MANYYTDRPEIAFYLNHPLMRRIVELKERGFSDKDTYEDAPVDYEDAIENYRRLLEIVGDVAGNIIEPNSESVDLEGPHLENGRMKYASKTVENMEAATKAGLWGMTMPRRYGGLNVPETIFSMASEIISAADAGFQNIGACRAAARPSTSSATRTRGRGSSPASAAGRPCPWTLPSRMPVPTCSA